MEGENYREQLLRSKRLSDRHKGELSKLVEPGLTIASQISGPKPKLLLEDKTNTLINDVIREYGPEPVIQAGEDPFEFNIRRQTWEDNANTILNRAKQNEKQKLLKNFERIMTPAQAGQMINYRGINDTNIVQLNKYWSRFEKKLRDTYDGLEFDTLEEFITDFIDNIDDVITGNPNRILRDIQTNVRDINNSNNRIVQNISDLENNLTGIINNSSERLNREMLRNLSDTLVYLENFKRNITDTINNGNTRNEELFRSQNTLLRGINSVLNNKLIQMEARQNTQVAEMLAEMRRNKDQLQQALRDTEQNITTSLDLTRTFLTNEFRTLTADATARLEDLIEQSRRENNTNLTTLSDNLLTQINETLANVRNQQATQAELQRTITDINNLVRVLPRDYNDLKEDLRTMRTEMTNAISTLSDTQVASIDAISQVIDSSITANTNALRDHLESRIPQQPQRQQQPQRPQTNLLATRIKFTEPILQEIYNKIQRDSTYLDKDFYSYLETNSLSEEEKQTLRQEYNNYITSIQRGQFVYQEPFKQLLKKLIINNRERYVEANYITDLSGNNLRGVISNSSYPIYGVGAKKVLRGEGLKQVNELPTTNYKHFGRYLIDYDKLNNNQLRVFHSSFNRVKYLPDKSVSDDFVNLVNYILEKKKYNDKLYNLLDSDDKTVFNILFTKSGLSKMMNIKIMNNELKEIEKNYKDLKERYEILTGEIYAGNDNPKLLKELNNVISDLKKTITQMVSNDLMPIKEAQIKILSL